MSDTDIEVIVDLPRIHDLLLGSDTFEMVLIEYISSILVYGEVFGQVIDDQNQNAIRLNRFSEITEYLVYNQEFEDTDYEGNSVEMDSLETEVHNCNDNLLPVSGVIDEFFNSAPGKKLIANIEENDWILENIIPYSENSVMFIFVT
jgi:hypothetical protein